jgi:hypothetical protein
MKGAANLYDTVLEIVDVRARRVIGIAQLEGYPRAILRNQRIALYKELEDGTPTVQIHSFRLPR